MRAALYARVSTMRQAQTQTIDQQVGHLREYIHHQGWTLDAEHIYRDDGYSGAKLARPGLDRLRDRSIFAEFKVIVVTTPDRLARNYVDQMVVIEELARHQIRVEFVDRPVGGDPQD